MLETKIAWFSKIETRDDALEVAKVASYAFFFLAALQVVLLLVTKSTGAFLAAAIMVVGALALLRHSHAAATVLLALSCAGALVTLANLFGAHLGGGSNVFVAGITVWVAVRAAQATSALRRMPDEDEDDEELSSVVPRR